ncbi:MAG: ATP-binding protein [Bacteroidia bacterium]|nr:ATP-binding protein [Bacteroidia bacterium]
MITKDFQNRIVAAVKAARPQFGSDRKHAVSLGINVAQYSRITGGDTDKVLSDAKWITIARTLGVNLRGQSSWNIAVTPVYAYITEQLKHCKKNSMAGLFCDKADIGKTVAAKDFVRKNENAVYIDGSQVKSKQKFVRSIAKEFGVGHTGRYADVYEDLVYYLNTIANPIVVIDEAGDLQYDAFLELKALWNATERSCGWYMLGADGLQVKMRRAIDNKKVGFAEIFRRFGKRYQKAVPHGKEEEEKFTSIQAALIIQANAPKGTDVQKMLRKTEGSLTRIYNELTKLN